MPDMVTWVICSSGVKGSPAIVARFILAGVSRWIWDLVHYVHAGQDLATIMTESNRQNDGNWSLMAIEI